MVTVEEIFEAVQIELGDFGTDSPQFANNIVLLPLLKSAWDEVMDALRLRNIPRLKRTIYAYLPPYTNYLAPSQLGLTDFDEPDFVSERGGITSAAVTATTAASPVVCTSTGHPFATNEELTLVTVGSQINGRWFVTNTDPDHFSLNGSLATEAYTPTSGLAIRSAEYFLPMRAPGALPSRAPEDRLYDYTYDSNAFRFVGAASARELEITYFSTGTCPTTGDIGFAGLRNFLIQRIAQKMAGPAGQGSRVSGFRNMADYYLGEFIRDEVQKMQRTVYQPLRYRMRGKRR